MKTYNMAEISLTEEEISAAVRVLRSGALRQGPECDRFEEEFARHVGAEFAVTSSNGSAALHLVYMNFIKPGDEVLVPSFTFIATASMVRAAGGVPIICDIDPATFLIDLKDAERRLTSKTVAISPVYLFGNCPDLNEIAKFAREHNLKIVGDAAQAHGTTFEGSDVGGFADFTCYSFYPSKNMFVGEGGMTLTKCERAYQRMRYLRSHGQTGKYYHTIDGLNYRLTDIAAAIGREQLKRLETMVQVRRENAAKMSENLAKFSGLQVQKVTPGCNSSWHQYCVIVDKDSFGFDRDEFGERLKSYGVHTGVHYPRGLHMQPVFEGICAKDQYPVTDKVANSIIALPIHHGLSTSNIDEICDYIGAIAGVQ